MATARLYPSAAEAITATVGRTASRSLVRDPAGLLLGRFGLGATPADRDPSALAAKPDAWFANQVSLARACPGYSAVPAVAALGPLLTMSSSQVYSTLAAQGRKYAWDALNQLSIVTLGLQLWSPARLYEVLVDFFANLLNVPNQQGNFWNFRHVHDRDVIRKNVFGRYSDMLQACGRSPAMLYYLSQYMSFAGDMNENYGRELLELHTVGLAYTESDVRNSALMLTGREIGPGTSDFAYNPAHHYVGPVKVLGFSSSNASAAAGLAAGDAYLDYLAHHPATALNLARKLCTYFVSDDPSDSLVTQVAQVYLASDTQIVPTVQAILRSDEFWASRGAKVRRPLENVIGTFRALNVTRPANLWTVLDNLRWTMHLSGHGVLECPTPNGYQNVAAAWRNSGATAQTLWLHRAIPNGSSSTVPPVDPATCLGGTTPATTVDAIDAVAVRLVGQRLRSSHTQALLTYLAEPAATPWATSHARSDLAGIVSLILDSPYHALS